MKKIIILTLLLTFVSIFSQTQDTVKTPINTIQDQYINAADTLPEFPGGINAFRNYVSKNTNASTLMKISGAAKSETKFLIDINGYISSVTTTGNNDILNKEMTHVIKSIKSRWKPATYQGSPIQYWFTLPMSFGE